MPDIAKRNRSIFQQYRLLPLLGVGVLFFVLFVLLGLLLWSFIFFQTQKEPAAAQLVPGLLYLGGVFLSTALMTWLIRGGTVFPAAILSLLAAGATLFLADGALLGVGNVLLKLVLTLVVGVLGFTLTKLWFVMRRVPRIPDDRSLADLSLNEPGA